MSNILTMDANRNQFYSKRSPRDVARSQPIDRFISATTRTCKREIYMEDILFYDGNPDLNVFINWILEMEQIFK